MSKKERMEISQDEIDIQNKYIEELNRIDEKRKKSCYIETHGCPVVS